MGRDHRNNPLGKPARTAHAEQGGPPKRGFFKRMLGSSDLTEQQKFWQNADPDGQRTVFQHLSGSTDVGKFNLDEQHRNEVARRPFNDPFGPEEAFNRRMDAAHVAANGDGENDPFATPQQKANRKSAEDTMNSSTQLFADAEAYMKDPANKLPF